MVVVKTEFLIGLPFLASFLPGIALPTLVVLLPGIALPTLRLVSLDRLHLYRRTGAEESQDRPQGFLTLVLAIEIVPLTHTLIFDKYCIVHFLARAGRVSDHLVM